MLGNVVCSAGARRVSGSVCVLVGASSKRSCTDDVLLGVVSELELHPAKIAVASSVNAIDITGVAHCFIVF